MRRLQNKIAESRRTLPFTLLYGTGIWLAAGLIGQKWWVQFACFVLSVLLMMELNNKNLLIRIYSRSVSVTFILLICMAPFLFPSWQGGFVEVCAIGSLLFFYDSYLDKTAVGLTFYTFLALGLGSIADVLLLLYVPLFWLMMAITIYSLSLRTFFASVLGLLTPYWFLAGWILYQDGGNFSALIGHFALLADWPLVSGHWLLAAESIPLSSLLTFGLTVCLWLIGTIHFLRNSYSDKIRVRQLYYSFIILGLWSILLFVLQPRHQGLAIRTLIIASSPLFGHFVALTRTKVTNAAAGVMAVLILLLTAYNLWMLLLPS